MLTVDEEDKHVATGATKQAARDAAAKMVLDDLAAQNRYSF
jgi:hypothetical protein